MKVFLRTNLDRYNSADFATPIDFIPRAGDYIQVLDRVAPKFIQNKLPTRLEVISVTHTERGTICELWYNEYDKKICDLAGAETL